MLDQTSFSSHSTEYRSHSACGSHLLPIVAYREQTCILPRFVDTGTNQLKGIPRPFQATRLLEEGTSFSIVTKAWHRCQDGCRESCRWQQLDCQICSTANIVRYPEECYYENYVNGLSLSPQVCGWRGRCCSR